MSCAVLRNGDGVTRKPTNDWQHSLIAIVILFICSSLGTANAAASSIPILQCSSQGSNLAAEENTCDDALLVKRQGMPPQTKLEKDLIAEHPDIFSSISQREHEIRAKNGKKQIYRSCFTPGYAYHHFQFYDFLPNINIAIVKAVIGESPDMFIFVSTKTGEELVKYWGNIGHNKTKTMFSFCDNDEVSGNFTAVVQCDERSGKCIKVYENEDWQCTKATWLESNKVKFKIERYFSSKLPDSSTYEYKTCECNEKGCKCR